MEWLQEIDVEKFLLFTLVLTRVSGLMATAPIYGTKEVPMQVAALLAVAVAVLIVPSQWHVRVIYPGNTLNYAVFVGSELLVGACLGLGVMVLFQGIQLAGEMIGHVGGLLLAEVTDPTYDTGVPIFSRLMFLVAMAVFVCIGGHRLVMAGLLDTFRAIPPGSAAVPQSMTDTFVAIITQSMALGIRAAAPGVTAILLATLVLGLIGRTVPQLNILAVGFSLNALLTLAVLAATLSVGVWAFQEQVEPTLEAVLESLQTPVG